MRIAIVDDNSSDLQSLAQGVTDFFHEVRLPFELRAFESAPHFLEEYEPGLYDIVFFDIIMGGMNGMELARSMRARADECKVVFITSSDAHAVDSYEVRATYYMLKPFRPQKLRELLKGCLKAQLDDTQFIEVMSDRRVRRFLLRDILYADIFNNAVHLHTFDELAKVYTTFRKFAPSLLQDARFLQCYQGCIVNMDHVRKIVNNTFLMSNGDVLPIRIKGSIAIKEAYAGHMFKKMRRDG